MDPIFDMLQRSRKSYTRAMEPICRHWQLTQNELDVLLFLANTPERDRAADIVERLGIAKSHVSMAVRDLGIRELLAQLPDPRDRRNTRLRLTERAQPIVREGQAVQKAFFARVFQGLSREEMAALRSMMGRIFRNIETMDGGYPAGGGQKTPGMDKNGKEIGRLENLSAEIN